MGIIVCLTAYQCNCYEAHTHGMEVRHAFCISHSEERDAHDEHDTSTILASCVSLPHHHCTERHDGDDTARLEDDSCSVVEIVECPVSEVGTPHSKDRDGGIVLHLAEPIEGQLESALNLTACMRADRRHFSRGRIEMPCMLSVGKQLGGRA